MGESLLQLESALCQSKCRSLDHDPHTNCQTVYDNDRLASTGSHLMWKRGITPPSLGFHIHFGLDEYK